MLLYLHDSSGARYGRVRGESEGESDGDREREIPVGEKEREGGREGERKGERRKEGGWSAVVSPHDWARTPGSFKLAAMPVRGGTPFAFFGFGMAPRTRGTGETPPCLCKGWRRGAQC